MRGIWVIQFKRHQCKHWRNKSAYFMRNDGLFEMRQLKAESKDSRHAAEYRIIEFTAKEKHHG